jgi:hypothetical protein
MSYYLMGLNAWLADVDRSTAAGYLPREKATWGPEMARSDLGRLHKMACRQTHERSKAAYKAVALTLLRLVVLKGLQLVE